MFSGIIEGVGEVVLRKEDGSNIRLGVKCDFTSELKIDQSVAHNGVCLTVVAIENDVFYTDVIAETLKRSALKSLKIGSRINLERSITLADRLDGHLVQGHVDQTAELHDIRELNGSWLFSFVFREKPGHVLIDKGSVAVNGTSLTISGLEENGFSVSVIPYTYKHTNFHQLKTGDVVNIEFDVIGKYVEKLVRN